MAADDDATAAAAAAAAPDAAPDNGSVVEDTGDGSHEGDVLDILHNGGLIKKVLRAGDGPRAELGNTVTVHYVAKLAADGTVVDDTRSAGAPLTFEAGQGDVLPGGRAKRRTAALDLVVALMNVGEVAELQAASRYGYGEHGRPPTVPKDADLVLTIELVAAEPTAMLEELPLAERLPRIERKRLRGNELYARGDLESALSAYTRALKALDAAPLEDDPTLDQALSEARRLRVACLSNQALCQWKLGDLVAAAATCDQCLALDPANVKVLYRSAAVLAARKEYDTARARLAQLLRLEPNNEAALALRREVEQGRAAQQAAEKELYSRMLRKSAGIYEDMPVKPSGGDGGVGDGAKDGTDAEEAQAPRPFTLAWLRDHDVVVRLAVSTVFAAIAVVWALAHFQSTPAA